MKESTKRTKNSQSTARKTAFALPCFNAEVVASLEVIQAKMPFWFHHFETLVFIRAMVGEDHHPTLWTLAALMLDMEEQRQGRRPKTLRDLYPMTRQDIIATHSSPLIDQTIKEGADVLNPAHVTLEAASHLALWQRTRDHLLSDIRELMNIAAAVGDFHFFKCWGDVCQKVARHCFGAKPITGSREWQNGEWRSETSWQEDWQELAPKPQAKSLLVIEIIRARTRLYLKLGRIPTNPEVSSLIVEQRANAGKLPKRFDAKKFVKTVATTTKRLGLSTAVIVRKKRPGDNSA